VKLRLLVAAPVAPSARAGDGGARVLNGVLSELAERHDVALVHAAIGELDDALAAKCVEAHAVPVPQLGPWGLRARGPLLVARGRSVHALEAGVAAIRRRVEAVASTFKPDVLQAEYASLGDVLRVATAPARVLTVYDPAAYLRQHVGVRDTPLPFVHRLDAWCAQREERRGLRAADAVVVLTDDDRRLIAADAPPSTALVTAPLGWDVSPVALDPVGADPPTVLFVGGFGHAPNVAAALRLAQEIFPLVRARCPEARLQLVGPDAPARVRALAGAGVEVTGWVPDVTELLDRAAVVVAPIAIGGGMRVKVVEALAAGKALVGTRLAVAGLQITDGDQARIADDDTAIATAVVDLLRDPEARRRLASGARAWAEQALSWTRMADHYDELYRRLTDDARRLVVAHSR
jgi:glycosyltransferase involved in cell wall biosynthesis